MNEKDFKVLLDTCNTIHETYPTGIVFIGGIAIYLHAINNESTQSISEFTHDADFYISIADMSDLRDDEEVTRNTRLTKSQIIKNSFEFDIYTERYSSLIVPFDAVMQHATTVAGIKLASLEHLTALKLEAYGDRKNSEKGKKDARDIIKIALVAQSLGFNKDLLLPYLSSKHIELLKEIQAGSQFVNIALGNAHAAKKMRDRFDIFCEQITAPPADLTFNY